MIWQLTIDAREPAALARFWEQALTLTAVPPPGDEPWQRHYRDRLEGSERFEDRLFDPAGSFPPLWFQQVPEEKAGKNRLHLDLYVTGRDDSLTFAARKRLVDDKVAELVSLGASVADRQSSDDPEDAFLFVVMRDPEGNEFCVA